MAPGNRPFNNGYNKKQEEFPDDKPTDPAESEKLTLIENSKSEFFKRRRIELRNLPNDPRPEDIHQTLFKDYPVSNVTVTDRNTARVTFVDSNSAKRAVDAVNGAIFNGNKVFIAYASPDNFLFLGNLALSIDEGILEDMLSPFGKVSRAFLLRSLKTGYMKGCGFVEFENREDAKNAKESLTGRFLRGRIVRTDWAPLVLNTYEDLHSRTLFIDRIPKDLFDCNVLRELFAQCGKVLFCDIAINPANGESRGFGFVDFDNADTAEKAQRMFSNYQIGNSQLRLAFGVPGRTGAHTLRQQSNSVGLNDLGSNKPAHPHPNFQGGNKPHYQKPYDRKPGMDNRTCYNCQQKGHVAKDCPKSGGKGGYQSQPSYQPPNNYHPPRPSAPSGPVPPQPYMPPQPPAGFMGAPPAMPPAMPVPGMPMMPNVPFVPGMPPNVPQYPNYYPGMPAGAPPSQAAPAAPAAVQQAPPTAPTSHPQAPAAVQPPPVYQPPAAAAAPPSVSVAPAAPAPGAGAPPQQQQPPPTMPPPPAAPTMQAPNAAAAVSHQTHLPIQPQQPAPTPVPDNTAQLLQLQTQIQQAAQQVQLLGQQAAQAYSQAQQAPTNELRNQYYQQYTQIYQQQQQHQQHHNTLVSQHTSLLRGSTTASA